jgi:hypothetical protein
MVQDGLKKNNERITRGRFRGFYYEKKKVNKNDRESTINKYFDEKR